MRFSDSVTVMFLLIYIYIMHYFIGLVIILVCVKCFNIDIRIYGTSLLLPFFSFLFHPGFFVILMLMYAFIVIVLLIVKQILMLIMYSAVSL